VKAGNTDNSQLSAPLMQVDNMAKKRASVPPRGFILSRGRRGSPSHYQASPRRVIGSISFGLPAFVTHHRRPGPSIMNNERPTTGGLDWIWLKSLWSSPAADTADPRGNDAASDKRHSAPRGFSIVRG
jgi:hypothetical protein